MHQAIVIRLRLRVMRYSVGATRCSESFDCTCARIRTRTHARVRVPVPASYTYTYALPVAVAWGRACAPLLKHPSGKLLQGKVSPRLGDDLEVPKETSY